jgi:hypothetical protein
MPEPTINDLRRARLNQAIMNLDADLSTEGLSEQALAAIKRFIETMWRAV